MEQENILETLKDFRLDWILYESSSKVTDYVGEGGEGEILKVKFRDKFYAQKKISNFKDSDGYELLKEFSILKSCEQCQNICRCHFFTYSDISYKNCLYLMDIYDDDLVSFINSNNRDKLSSLEFMKIFSQMVNSLAFLNKKRIVHRDIKPQNILINKDMHVALCDFGVSKILDERVSDNDVVGTRLWMSPELRKACQKIFHL